MNDKCQTCGYITRLGAKFCLHCGRVLLDNNSQKQNSNRIEERRETIDIVTNKQYSQLPIVSYIAFGIILTSALFFLFYITFSTFGTRITDASKSTTITLGRMLDGREIEKYTITSIEIRELPSMTDSLNAVVGQIDAGQLVRGVMYSGVDERGYWLKLSDGRGYIDADKLSDGPPTGRLAPQIVAPNTTPTMQPSRDWGPTFSCARATTSVEQFVCNDSNLAMLDRQMGALYRQVRSNRQIGQQVLVDQRLFLASLSRCPSPQCVEEMYHNRINELSRY